MYPVKNPARDTRPRTFISAARAIIKLAALCLVTAAVPVALYVRVDSKSSKTAINSQPPITVQAAGRGESFFKLQDGRKMAVEYRGDTGLIEALRSGAAHPRALASADFDGNGTPDVAAGYSFNGMGIVTLQRGNPEAFAPADDSVFVRMQQGYNPESLLPVADVYPVPVPVDFLATGNFTKDSEKDVLFAAKGGGLYLMAGDGAGHLGAPQQIALPGPVTALAVGEFRAADGFTDIAVGVTGTDGESLLIFDGANGLSNALVQYQLSEAASAIEFGGLDDDPFQDVAVAAGNEILIVHGWGRKVSVDARSQLERISTGTGVNGLVIGHFTWDREARKEIATVTDGGTVQVVEQANLDTRPFTESEKQTRSRGNLKLAAISRTADIEAVSGWHSASSKGWSASSQLDTDATSLVKTHLGHGEMDDLMLLGTESGKLEVLRSYAPDDLAPGIARSSESMYGTSAVDVEGSPIAVLPLPQKLNGFRDTILLTAGSTTPTIIPTAPTATITVDRVDDPSGAALTAASACTAALNDCSLRGAFQFANLPANAGTAITLPASTYVLSINGTSQVGCDSNTVGDLLTNQSTTLTGAGAATTIIRQTGTGPGNDGDRVMCMNTAFAPNLVWTFSAVTFTGGRDGMTSAAGTIIGGGGIIGGELDNDLTLTNVTLSNNQVTQFAISNNLGGGGIQITGGDLTVTNCTIGGSSAPGTYADRTSVNNANSQIGSGGGIAFTPSSPMHSGGTGVLTVTGTTFSRNTASGIGGGGADLLIFAFAAPGGIGSGSASFGTSTFSNNSASGSGGAIVLESLGATVATTAFNNNSAGNLGGAIYLGGGSGLTLNGTTPSITFSANTATNGGSAIGVNVGIDQDVVTNVRTINATGGVQLTGTNTILTGQDVFIGTNGAWTNQAGSSLTFGNLIQDSGGNACGGCANLLMAAFKANNTTTNIAGNWTMNGATFVGDSGTVNLAGNFGYTIAASAGTFTGGTGTVNLNGTGAQSITNGASITFFNLTDSNVTQPLTANNSFNVNGSLNVNGASAIFNPVAAAIIGGTGTLTGTGTARVTRIAATADFSSQYTITNKTLTNLTVEYIGTAAQVLSPITFGPLKINNGNGVNITSGTSTVNGLLTLTTGALGVGNQTLVINNGTTVVGGSITSNATGTVNYNQGSAGQDVRAFNYGNLTFSAFTKVLASTGTIGIAGTFNPNGVTSGHTITGSTIDFNGTGAQTVPVFNYNNLTISGARGGATVTLASGTIGVAATFNPSATAVVYSFTGNTFDFNGTGAQTVPAFNYNNLTISGNRGGAAITLASGNIGIAGIFNPSVTNNTFVTTGNTVIFNGTLAQSVPAFNFNGLTINNAAGASLGGNVTVGGALTLTSGALGVGTNTLTLNGAVSAAAGSLTSAATGTVIYNQGSNGQATVLAANYGNLTFSNFSKTLASAGTIGIAGTFTPGTGTGHTITGSTINFNGAGPQNIPGFTYNNLTSSGGGVARILDPVNTIKIAGVFTPGTDVYTITGSTVEYNGSAAQSLPATFTTYNNLTLNNPTTVAGFAGLTVQGLLRVQAGTFTSSSNYNNVQIDLGATMVATAGSTINVSGNWTNNGTFTPSTGTVVFNGNNNTQTLAGSTTFNNLTINHTGTGNVTAVGSTLSVTGLMRVQGGTFNVGGSTFNNVQIDSGQTLAGTNATTINVSGNWTNNGGTFTHNGNTVNFTGGGAQAINGTAAAQTFNDVIVNKSGGALTVGGSTTSLTTNNLTMTLGSFTAPATLDINGNAVLSAGTLTSGANITVAGNWTNNGGAFSGGAGTVTFDGGVGQTIGGTTATTFNNLTNGNANGLAMANDNTVNGILALSSADITVAATRTLTQPVAGSSSGTFDVNGRVQRNGFVTGGAALSFGNPFNSLQVTAGTAPANVMVDLARSVPTGGQGFPTAVQRTYTITPSAAGFTGTLRLHYLPGELNGNDPTLLNLWRFDNTLPTPGWRPNPATARDCAAGCTTNNSNFWVERSGVTTFSPWTLNSTVAPTATSGVVTGRIADDQGNPVAGAVVKLTGTQNRKFITDANGVYRFENVETNGFYTVTPSRANYSFSPAERSFSQIGQTTEATFAATAASSGLVNPLDTPEYFVRQHYLDFLNREPDEAGFNFWSDQIIGCGADQGCIERKRVNVSAAYYLSIEFQRTGVVVDGLYRAAYGARPDFAHFLPDTRTVGQGVQVNKEGWEALLAANTEAFVNSFVNRAEFHAAYDNLSNADYVDTLISHTSVSFTAAERDALVNGLIAGSMTRAQVLRGIAEDGRFVSAKFNETFVMMEYYGYLRRDYDASGYAFWLNKLNQFNGNFEQAEMVKAFIVSGEYRDRFPH